MDAGYRIHSKWGPVVQLVRTLACHARGQGFESPSGRQSLKRGANASVAQLVEQGTENPRVVGSIPTGGTRKCGFSSFGRASPCQGEGGGFEPRNPLHKKQRTPYGVLVFYGTDLRGVKKARKPKVCKGRTFRLCQAKWCRKTSRKFVCLPPKWQTDRANRNPSHHISGALFFTTQILGATNPRSQSELRASLCLYEVKWWYKPSNKLGTMLLKQHCDSSPANFIQTSSGQTFPPHLWGNGVSR